MPGRIVGRTQDADGRTAYTLTPQACERHIRGSRTTANICATQQLMVIAATIHMALMGAEGLARTAARCHANTQRLGESECPETIGRLTAFAGNAGVLLRAYIYARMLGREGMSRVAEFATLNANYLRTELMKVGFEAVYPERRATHECIITPRQQARDLGVNTIDYAKRLLDHGVHMPITYDTLLVPEGLLIEPTETEHKEALDRFVDVMKAIQHEAETDPALLKSAPQSTPVRRLDEVVAGPNLDLAWELANG